MPFEPGLDVATQLDADAAFTLGTNLFYGPERPEGDGMPHKAVFCLSSGGPGPEEYADGSGISRWIGVVQIISRSDPGRYADGLAQARLIRDLLHIQPATGYHEWIFQESEPIYLGTDETDRHRWSSNLEVWYEA